MLLEFDIGKMNHIRFQPSPEKEDKGWSYSFVYYLQDLKSIYNIIYAEKRPVTTAELLTICQKLNIKSESGKQWTSRNLLEIVNALKNYDLLDLSTNMAKAGAVFSSDSMNLTKKDLNVFRHIYLSYFRFSDFHRMFNSIGNNPIIIYAFKDGQRFFNRFARIDNNEIYCIDDSNQDTMRFWEVYTKWGETLWALNKCLASSLGIKITNPLCKNVYVCNLTHPLPNDFSICDYLQEKMHGSSYYIPSIEWNLIQEYGFPVEAIKKKILQECSSKSHSFRLQKASFLTVDPEELKLFPICGNTYMSHILKIS